MDGGHRRKRLLAYASAICEKNNIEVVRDSRGPSAAHSRPGNNMPQVLVSAWKCSSRSFKDLLVERCHSPYSPCEACTNCAEASPASSKIITDAFFSVLQWWLLGHCCFHKSNGQNWKKLGGGGDGGNTRCQVLGHALVLCVLTELRV